MEQTAYCPMCSRQASEAYRKGWIDAFELCRKQTEMAILQRPIQYTLSAGTKLLKGGE